MSESGELAAACQAIVEDVCLTEHEVHYLADWLSANPSASAPEIGRKLAEALNEILADGVIDEAELHRLAPLLGEAIARQYNAPPEVHEPPPSTNTGLVAGVKGWLANRREKRHLEQMEKRRHEQERIAARQKYIEHVIHAIRSGEEFNRGAESFLAQRDERVCWAEPGVLEEIRVVVRSYVGGHASTRIRVAKGLSFSVGGSRGQLVSERGLIPICKGRLIITTHRMAFVGDTKSIVMKLGKLVDVQVSRSGIQFCQSGQNARLIRFDNLNGDIVVAVMNHVMEQASG